MTRHDAPELAARDLRLHIGGRAVLDGADLSLRAGELVALTGPSGAGKSTLARSLVGLAPGSPTGRITARGAGVQLDVDASDPALAAVRGRVVVYLPQAAPAALDPLRRVGQMVPAAWLARVGLPASVAAAWPHTLSGGEATRVLLALGLARGAPLLLADEPLEGLDPWSASAIVELLATIVADGVGVLWITHHRALAEPAADRVLHLTDGRLVGPT
jgi:ABC-type glutathione transport system ATPase component